VPALPTGRTLYATLLIETNGAWTRFQEVTFTAAPREATFTEPIAGETGVATTKAFTWSTIPAAQGYYMVVGTPFSGGRCTAPCPVLEVPQRSGFSLGEQLGKDSKRPRADAVEARQFRSVSPGKLIHRRVAGGHKRTRRGGAKGLRESVRFGHHVV